MDSKLLLTLFVFFLLSNQLYRIIWEILKSIVYLMGILFGLNYLNPELAQNIRTYITNFISLDQAFISNIATTASSVAGNLLKSSADITKEKKEKKVNRKNN